MRRHVAALTSVGLLTVVGCHIGGKYDCVWEQIGARPDQPLVAGHFAHGTPVPNSPAGYGQGGAAPATAEPALAVMPSPADEVVVPAKVESKDKSHHHVVAKANSETVVSESGTTVAVEPAPVVEAPKPAKTGPVAKPVSLPPAETPGVSAADMSREN